MSDLDTRVSPEIQRLVDAAISNSFGNGIRPSNECRDELLAALSSLEADRARLDWLEVEDRRVRLRHKWPTQKLGYDLEWCVGGTVQCPENFAARTLREAIDAARSDTSPGETQKP